MNDDIYVGIDIGKTKHCAAAINQRADVILKPRFIEQNQQGFESLHTSLQELTKEGSLKIGIEATGHYWLHLYTFLHEQGWTVEVFNPVLSNAQGRTHLRGRKTDKDDAITIAKTLRDGGYISWQLGQDNHTQMKLLCRQRQFIVHELANAKRRFTGLMDLAFPEFQEHFSDPYGKAPLALLEQAPTAAALQQWSIRKLAAFLRKNSNQRVGLETAKKLIEKANSSIALSQDSSALRTCIQSMLEQIRFFKNQIQTLENDISELFDEIKHPIKSIPGIGKITAPIIIAECGDFNRFKGGYKKLLAYAGLDPRTRESGQWKGTVKMSKRGSPTLRTALFKAASMGRLHCPELAAIYDTHRKQKGKNHRVAVSHVARKIVQIIWATCRSENPFDATKISPN